MRILLIKPKHIGDTLILTPTAVGLKQAYPDAEIWVLVRRGCEQILAGCPEINRVLTLAGVEKTERSTDDLWQQFQSLLQLRRVKFDFVFELGDGQRARFFAGLARARRRYSVKPSDPLKSYERRIFSGVSTFDWQTCHRVEKDYRSVHEFLSLPTTLPPLRFAKNLTQAWTPSAALSDFCVLQIGSRQGFNLWPKENWYELGAALLKRFSHLVITCGPASAEVAEARWLQSQLGSRALATLGEINWPQMAGLLYRARLHVGLSTATLHLAAACGCPVVAIFARTIEEHWHPWQVPHRIVTTPGYLPSSKTVERYAQIKARRMEEVRPESILLACDDLLAKSCFKSAQLPTQQTFAQEHD